jgi:hypothetical protein
MAKKKETWTNEDAIAFLKEKKKKDGKLSKLGEWILKHPNGIGEIVDRRAVMR